MCPTPYRNSLKTTYYKLGYSVKPELQRSSGCRGLKTLSQPVTFHKDNDFISVYFLILATLIKPYVAVRLINWRLLQIMSLNNSYTCNYYKCPHKMTPLTLFSPPHLLWPIWRLSEFLYKKICLFVCSSSSLKCSFS